MLKDPNLTPAQLQAPVTRHNFWTRATHYIIHGLNRSAELPVIKPGTAQRRAWENYFRGMGWTPAAFRADSDFTAPTEYPEQFDPMGWAHRKEAPLKVVAPRPTYEELKTKYGPTWGINAHDPGARYPQFARMTKEQALARLRAEFGDQVDAVPDAPLGEWRRMR